jgi:hypothetical protein
MTDDGNKVLGRTDPVKASKSKPTGWCRRFTGLVFPKSISITLLEVLAMLDDSYRE